MRNALIIEKAKFANLTSNLKLSDKTFNDSGYKTAILRAALDLTVRTLKPQRDDAIEELKKELIDTQNSGSFFNQVKRYFESDPKSEQAFDAWHTDRCHEVLAIIQKYYLNGDGTSVCYGKAQKIVNITFKGCYSLVGADEKEEYFKHCHMALDSFTLAWYNRNHRENKVETPWSNLQEDQYTAVVSNIRVFGETDNDLFGALTPLQKEFLIWPLEIMIITVKGINNCFGGIIDGDYVNDYFENYGLSNDLRMANIILGKENPDILDEAFANWLKRIPKNYKKHESAEFLLDKYQIN